MDDFDVEGFPFEEEDDEDGDGGLGVGSAQPSPSRLEVVAEEGPSRRDPADFNLQDVIDVSDPYSAIRWAAKQYAPGGQKYAPLSPVIEDLAREGRYLQTLLDGPIVKGWNVHSLDPKDRDVAAPVKRYLTSRSRAVSTFGVLRGWDSSSKRVCAITADLCDELDAKFPISDVDEKSGLRKPPGVTESFGRLRSVQGVPHNPTGVPPYDATGARKAIAASKPEAVRLKTRLDATSKEVARILAKLMFSNSGVQPVRIRRQTSSGFLTMSKRPDYKLFVCRMWQSCAPQIVALFKANAADALAEIFGIFFLYMLGARMQADMVTKDRNGGLKGKDRLVQDWVGNWVIADKTLPAGHPGIGTHLSCRYRKISASALAATFPDRCFAASATAALNHRYPYTFHHHHATSIADKISPWGRARGFDVDNHDIYILRDLLEIERDAIADAFGETAAQWFWATLTMPQVVKNDYRPGTWREDAAGLKKGTPFMLLGNPYDIRNFDAEYGNPSGHPWTSMTAKFAGVFYCFDWAVKIGVLELTIEAFELALLGLHPLFALLNAGDNLELLDNGDLPEFVSEYVLLSESSTFLGYVVTVDDYGTVGLVSSPNSYVINFWCPGRSAYDPQRGDPAVGFDDRHAFYSRTSPVVDDILAVTNDVVYGHVGQSLTEIVAGLRAQSVSPDQEIGRTEADRLYLMNPDVIHYRVDVEELSPDILNADFVKVPREAVEAVFEAFRAPTPNRIAQ